MVTADKSLAFRAALDRVMGLEDRDNFIKPTKYANKTYLFQKDILLAMSGSDDVDLNQDYPMLMEFLRDNRGEFDLGAEINLNPPDVDWDRSGTYYLLIQFPSHEDIKEVVNDMLLTGQYKPTRSRYRPEHTAQVRDMAAYAARRLSVDYSLLEKLAEKIAFCFQESDSWEEGHSTLIFTRPIPMDTEDLSWVQKKLDTATPPIRRHELHSWIAQDVYSYAYFCDDEDFSQEFLDLAEQLTRDANLVSDSEYYREKPVELPENIVEIGYEILGNKDLIFINEYGRSAMPLHLIRSTLREDYDIVISNSQLEHQLIGAVGKWKEPLVMLGYRATSEELRTSAFEKLDYENNFFRGLSKLRTEGEARDLTTVRFASGYPIPADGLVVDRSNNQLVYLSMAGDKTAVRANWAALMEDRYVGSSVASFKVGTSRNHKFFRTELPSGMLHMMMVHNNAILSEHSSEMEFVYIPRPDVYDDSMPEEFIDVMDNILQVPVLKEWAKRLWVIGRMTQLITWAAPPDKQVGGTFWKIRNQDKNWEELISSNIAAGQLSFDA